MLKTQIIKRNGYVIEFVPIIIPCTYHHPNERKVCKNCDDTMKWVDGYHMVITNKKGQKSGFIVDNIK